MAPKFPSPSYLTCATCGHAKPVTEFPRNKRSSTGYHCYCKPCHNSRNRRFVKERHGGSRHYHLRWRYGIRADEVDEFIRQQGGLCAVCRKREAKQVDHDHTTGAVRAIVRILCNAAMGAFHDDPDLIRRYQVDAAQVAWMILQQGGVCALCGSGKPEHVDHDDRSKRIRGILCFNCNRGLGKFGDDVELMSRAVDHLESVVPR